MATPDRVTFRDFGRLREYYESPLRTIDWVRHRHALTDHLHDWIDTNIQIDFDNHRQRYVGRLFNKQITFDASQQTDSQARNLIRQRLIQNYMGEMAMPTPTFTIDHNITTVRTEYEYVPPPPPPTSPTPPVFHLQQNTQDIELRRLRRNYPNEIFHYDFQLPVYRALSHERSEIREQIERLRRTQAAKHAYQTALPKFRESLMQLFSAQLGSRQISFISNADAQLNNTVFYNQTIEAIRLYQEYRSRFLQDRIRFAKTQADYNQRAAMIRQKARIPLTINNALIMEIVSTWNNVWGIAVTTDNEFLRIRLGLCDIVMEDSATVSRYDDPKAIMLAPFYITIRLDTNGRATCTSDFARGLSRSDQGHMEYDFHPHQLSDTPCFGTFGQTLIDTAAQGDMISYIGTLIAFYSQYNSQDSAGVEARQYHPSLLRRFRNADNYSSNMIVKFEMFSPFHIIQTEKLEQSVARYVEYHELERQQPAPEREDQYWCTYCGEVDVSDNCTYYATNTGDRICPDCWQENFCNECDRYHEDCICEPEE